MKTDKRPERLDDVELVPDAAERLEGAIKHAFKRQSPTAAKPRRVQPTKPKRRPSRRP